ncbi:TIGR03016 family PEP-CTERM system-associated outer membrane protein [Colwellia sp. 12G3]|uniref:TIGR03016 family PEP-CTERM system-associated outer membrane protein n=1 Tax=Colwellia sp. 12G3 TaxID=2058299 RepID=UPI000C339A98|nr:TIGR03016 family PEP-CTERM system-associated outer membrane protein [Colwellia sp. 12G3]PKI15764.1 TIGR03016 family PEP-CTERM system-associated outer membrane protein [Colwellia sp. 12G3]
MVIMDMAMAEKTSKAQLNLRISAIAGLLLSASALAGEWQFDPSLGLTETYTDNIELNQFDKKSSLVSQFIIGANASFSSKKLQFSFAGTETLAGYSHDSKLNDDYQTLLANASYSLWQDKLKIIASSSITNVSKNDAGNSLADLITADTVQQRNYSTGLQYNSANSDYYLSSSLIASLVDTEDNIGESNGYTALINSKNGNAARYVFWQIDGSFANQENNQFTSENYQLETKLGVITPYKLNPFIRLYNERVTGTAAGSNPDAIPSWGPGLSFQAAKHFIIDLSYNYVRDNTEASDDYIAASVDWQPSARTSLKAGYSKRFFGDSYELDFSHRNRRLTNTISYHETIEVFDRNNYQEINGVIWCPNSATGVDECLPLGENPDDFSEYTSVPVTSLELAEDNEFSLNKRLAWQSQLALARTTFTLDLSNRERESLSTGVIDDYLKARVSVNRRMSARSDVTVYVDYSKNVIDKDKPDGPRQEDTYKTLSATYNRSLASSLNAFLTLQYLDRESNFERYTYNEARASINITKDF